MRLLFLVATFACVALGYSLPTRREINSLNPKCADPTYACQDLATAHSCGVVKSCIYDIWSTMSAPDDNNEVCDICKEMVKEARDQLLSNMTQEEIKEVFEGSCRLLPFKGIVDMCINIVDDFIPELIEMLASRMDPNMVCTVSGLCNINKFPFVSLNVPKEKAGDNLTCEFCENLVGHVKDMISSKTTEEEMKTACLNMCQHAGSFADECTKLVNENFDKIYNLLIQELDPHTVCSELGLCNQNAIPLIKVTPARLIANKASIAKLLPTNFVNEVLPLTKTSEAKRIDSIPIVKISPPEDTTRKNKYNLYKSNEEEIESNNIFDEKFDHPALLFKKDTECAFCKAMMFFIKNDLKDDRTEVNVKKTLDSICSRWLAGYSKYCHSFLKQNYADFVKHIASDTDFNEICDKINICPKEGNEKVHSKNLQTLNGIKNEVECELCEKLVQILDKELDNPTVREDVKNALDKACDMFPDTMATKCENFINQNIDMILAFLKMEMDPSQICTALKICPGIQKVVQKVKKDNPECELCKAVMKFVQEELTEERTEDEIRNALDKACSYLPNSFATKCQKFIDDYAEMIIALIGQGMDPSTVCSSINMCSTGNLVCSTCQSALHFIQNLLYENDTQVEIKNVCKRFCNLLPESLEDNCEAFIDQYGSSFLVLLAQELDPSVACVELDFCTNSTIFFHKKTKSIQIKQLNLDKCTLCTTVVDYVDKLLEDDYVDKEITSVIEKVCSVVPKSVHDQCTSTIEAYGPYILQMIGQMANSKEICQEIDLCPRVAGQVHLLGGDKCAFGPSYWCLTKAHAAACKAEIYCKQNDWKE